MNCKLPSQSSAGILRVRNKISFGDSARRANGTFWIFHSEWREHMNRERPVGIVGCRYAEPRRNHQKTRGRWTALFTFALLSMILPALASAQRLDGTLRVSVSDSTGA